MASGSLEPRSKLEISWNSLIKLRISQNTKWADKNILCTDVPPSLRKKSGEETFQAKIKTAQKIRMYKELRETTRTYYSVFNFLSFSIHCQCTWKVIGYNMGSLCVLWFIWLLSLYNTNNWWHSSLARKRQLKSIFSFLQPSNLTTSAADYIGCDSGLHFLARLTETKITYNRIFIPSNLCTMRLANLWTY